MGNRNKHFRSKTHRMLFEENTLTDNDNLRKTNIVLSDALKECEKYVLCHITQLMPKGGVLDGKTLLGIIRNAIDNLR